MTTTTNIPPARIGRPSWRNVVILVVNDGLPGFMAMAGGLSDSLWQDLPAQKAVQAVAMGVSLLEVLPGVTVRARPIA